MAAPRRMSDDAWPPPPVGSPKRRLVAVIGPCPNLAQLYRRCVPPWLSIVSYQDLPTLKARGLPSPDKTLFLVADNTTWISIARCSWVNEVLGAIIVTPPGGKDTRGSFRRGDEVIYAASPLTEADAKECTSAMLYLAGHDGNGRYRAANTQCANLKMETATLRSSASHLELNVEAQENLIKLYERQLGSSDQATQISQFHILVDRLSRVNPDGSVVLAPSPFTPPRSPECRSPSPRTGSYDESDTIGNEEASSSHSTGGLRDENDPFPFLRADFPLFQYHNDELVEMIWPIFSALGTFALDRTKFGAFAREVQLRYQKNHYHSFRHGFDVLQTVAVLVHSMKERVLPDVTLLGLLVAALCHDIKHPGVTNAFLVKAKSPVATLYNGQSVLENFHALSTIALLHEPECDILEILSPEKRKSCEATIVEAILWTDMSVHKEKLAVFSEMERCNDEDHNLIAAMLLKCSDVSNVWKAWKDSYRWSSLLVDEWRTQGDTEVALFGERSIGPPPGLDNKELSAYIGKTTGSFIGLVVEPMIALLTSHVPSLKPLFQGLDGNATRYRRLEKEGTLADC